MRYGEIVAIDKAIKEKNYSQLYDIIAQPNFDINQVGRCDWTPLFVAADIADVKLVETFLKMGANPNCVLTANDYPSVLAITISNLSDTTDRALGEKYLQIIKLLLQYGAREIPITYSRHTALHVAAMFGNEIVVDLLMRYGFKPERQNRIGKTPIDYAIDFDHLQLAKKMQRSEYVSLPSIIEAGVIDKEYYEECAPVIDEELKKKSIPQNVQNKIKYHFFYHPGKMDSFKGPIIDNDLESLQKSFREGYVIFDPLVHKNGKTPLDRAVENNNQSMAKLLIQHGSIFSDGYKKDISYEMQVLLRNTKQKQLEILKEELNLSDKDPTHCTLSFSRY